MTMIGSSLVKDRVRQSLAFLCYWLGVDLLFYFLNRKVKKIITFHNVLPVEMCRSIPHVGVSTDLATFEKTIDEIAMRFSFSTDICDANTITLTFDDGTFNEYEIAGESLKKRNVPAVLFVAGDMIGANEFTVPVVERLCVWVQFVPFEIARENFDVASREDLWVKVVQPAYRKDWETRGERCFEKFDGIYPYKKILAELPTEWKCLRMRGVTLSHLQELRLRGWLIGWHTKSHFPLGCLPLSERRVELDAPKEMKNVVLGYPYGDPDAVGTETPYLAAEMGYPCAVSNCSNRTPMHGPYFMMRMEVSSNRYDIHFQLSGAKYFFQNLSLLPKKVELVDAR